MVKKVNNRFQVLYANMAAVGYSCTMVERVPVAADCLTLSSNNSLPTEYSLRNWVG